MNRAKLKPRPKRRYRCCFTSPHPTPKVGYWRRCQHGSSDRPGNRVCDSCFKSYAQIHFGCHAEVA